MKIRLAIGISNKKYLERLVKYLETYHLDRLELMTFSNPESLMNCVSGHETDVMLLDQEFADISGSILTMGKSAILCEEDDNSELGNGVVRISMFKKPELIYKDILNLYSEVGNHSQTAGRKGNPENSCRIVMVSSFSGGTGVSVFAAAYAKHLAAEGRKVLYISFSPLEQSEAFFTGEANGSIEDIIFAIKSRNVDLSIKLEAVVGTDPCGVRFFKSSGKALDLLDMTVEEQEQVLETLVKSGVYDVIILDTAFSFDNSFANLANMADRIVMVSNGEMTANMKFMRAMESLHIVESQQTWDGIIGKICLVYNKFSSSCSSNEIEAPGVEVIGKIPPVTHAVMNSIVEYIQRKEDIFDRI